MTPEAWQALLATELPPAKGRALLRELGLNHSRPFEDVFQSFGLNPAEKKRFQSTNFEALDKVLGSGAGIVSYRDYPEELVNWDSNPIGIFVAGDWNVVHAPTVGIVGTRGATSYGKAVATKFAEAFAHAGVTVVSGGAIGIDAAAHKGAISAGGKTAAVMAGGLDRLYPALHHGLFQQIRNGNGCLISQFACGTKPDYYRFLIRNHLVAALSQVLLVVEAPERSGAISTAHRANELGRQVFVVPANIENQNFRGSHALVRDGATLVDHPDQVLDAIGIAPSHPTAAVPAPSDTGSKILETLSTEPLAVEFLLERTGLPMSDVLGELTMLELDGRVLRESGGYILKP